jgi:hypothetical protein
VPGLTDQPAAQQVGGAHVPQDGHQHQLLLRPGLAIKKNPKKQPKNIILGMATSFFNYLPSGGLVGTTYRASYGIMEPLCRLMLKVIAIGHNNVAAKKCCKKASFLKSLSLSSEGYQFNIQWRHTQCKV